MSFQRVAQMPTAQTTLDTLGKGVIVECRSIHVLYWFSGTKQFVIEAARYLSSNVWQPQRWWTLDWQWLILSLFCLKDYGNRWSTRLLKDSTAKTTESNDQFNPNLGLAARMETDIRHLSNFCHHDHHYIHGWLPTERKVDSWYNLLYNLCS